VSNIHARSRAEDEHPFVCSARDVDGLARPARVVGEQEPDRLLSYLGVSVPRQSLQSIDQTGSILPVPLDEQLAEVRAALRPAPGIPTDTLPKVLGRHPDPSLKYKPFNNSLLDPWGPRQWPRTTGD
jgi:hypothetical protein